MPKVHTLRSLEGLTSAHASEVNVRVSKTIGGIEGSGSNVRPVLLRRSSEEMMALEEGRVEHAEAGHTAISQQLGKAQSATAADLAAEMSEMGSMIAALDREQETMQMQANAMQHQHQPMSDS